MMKPKISFKLEEIAKCIFEGTETHHYKLPIGLYNGEFGILLFMLYYSRFSKIKKYRRITTKYCETLLKRLGSELRLHTFCGGLAGILYLFEFLKENQIFEIDISEVKGLFEEYLIRNMRNDILNNHYDFMHGAIGVGLYFLKSETNKEIIQELIDFLLTTSEVDSPSGGIKWKAKIKEDFMGYNIALSHGMSSVVLFLCRVIESGNGNSKVKELLKRTMIYILYQEIDVHEYGSFFPTYSKESSTPLSGSRLAWCYGDLGIAYAILRAGEVTGNKDWKNKGLNILIHSTSRKSNVYEAGICHGCMSMVLIYNKLHWETNIQSFSNSVNYWLRQSLKLSCFENGLAGYKSNYDNNWVSDYTLLTGISGIGLSYLSYLEAKPFCWDELFLL